MTNIKTLTGTAFLFITLLLSSTRIFAQYSPSLEFLHSPSAAGYGSKLYFVDEGTGNTSLRIGVRGNNVNYADALYIRASNNGSAGFVGIGNVNPTAELHVSHFGGTTVGKFEQKTTSQDNASPVVLISQQSPTNSSGLKIDYSGTGGDEYTYNRTAALEIITGSNHRAITITNNSGFRLFEVNSHGSAKAREVIVSSANPFPDYVFENTYALRPLSQVESFIKENKHLPEIPSATEVKANGINLGEMDALLLKKIEELTLYTIEINKKMEEIQKENIEIKRENTSIKNELNKQK